MSTVKVLHLNSIVSQIRVPYNLLILQNFQPVSLPPARFTSQLQMYIRAQSDIKSSHLDSFRPTTPTISPRTIIIFGSGSRFVNHMASSYVSNNFKHVFILARNTKQPSENPSFVKNASASIQATIGEDGYSWTSWPYTSTPQPYRLADLKAHVEYNRKQFLPNIIGVGPANPNNSPYLYSSSTHLYNKKKTQSNTVTQTQENTPPNSPSYTPPPAHPSTPKTSPQSNKPSI